MTEYRLWMEQINELPEGYLCGRGKRQNRVYYRTDVEADADTFDLGNAISFFIRYSRLGYPCRVVPEVSPETMIRIMTSVEVYDV